MPSVLKTNTLTKRYGSICALNCVNIEIRKGDIYGIVGRNGAGKTTLMKLITGLTRASEGEMFLFGENHRVEKFRSRLGTIVETPEFFPYFTARQNLEYFRVQRGIVERDVVEKALNEVNLSDTGKKKFKAFSLGMKQRLGIALALMGNPDFLILDEPINGLDPEGIVEIRQLLLRLNKEKQITILISSHILSELSNLATRFAIIDQGVIKAEITAEELWAKSGTYLEIAVDNPRRAVTILEQKLNLHDYRLNQQNRILLAEGFECPGEISKALMQGGLDLYEFSLRQTTLEDYFLKVIGGKRHA